MILSKIDRIRCSEFTNVLPEEFFSILNETRIHNCNYLEVKFGETFLVDLQGIGETLRNPLRIEMSAKCTIIDSTHRHELSCPLYVGVVSGLSWEMMHVCLFV